MSHPLEPVLASLRRHLPHLFAVVDPAREPTVLDWLRGAGLPYQCLFQGKKAKSLAEEAPYLVHLSHDEEALSKLVESHHDGSAVTYLVAEASFYEVRRHLRRIQLVRSHEDEVLFFRFYDPRIARVFLPTCDAEQIEWMFGDVVQMWLTESDELGQLIEHRVERGDDGRSASVIVGQGNEAIAS